MEKTAGVTVSKEDVFLPYEVGEEEDEEVPDKQGTGKETAGGGHELLMVVVQILLAMEWVFFISFFELYIHFLH